MIELQAQSPDITLVAPDVERDAPLAVAWLEGDIGRSTLKLMGNDDAHNKPSTLDEEKERVQSFIDAKDQLTWMIRLQDKVVGTVWVNLTATEYLPGPSVHIMIGDPEARGHGVGGNTINAVIDYLRQTNQYDTLYSRHLTSNERAGKLLADSGFEQLNQPYNDHSHLTWQNVSRSLV
jgi:RimJ/RimL family protein N-acetyltransferase